MEMGAKERRTGVLFAEKPWILGRFMHGGGSICFVNYPVILSNRMMI